MIKLRGGEDLGHFGWQYNWWGTYDEVPKIGYPVAISNGQVIQVPNGAALALGVQNSANNTRIGVQNQIDVTLSSLSALQSGQFAAALRQQAIDSLRR